MNTLPDNVIEKKRRVLGPTGRFILKISNWDVNGEIPNQPRSRGLGDVYKRQAMRDAWYGLLTVLALDLKVNFFGAKWVFTRLPSPITFSKNLDRLGIPWPLGWLQEIIFKTKPDLIIETGIAHGGSLIYFASLMMMMGLKSDVLGIDIDIREHNKKAIEAHPMSKKITMFEGSSIDDEMIAKVHEFSKQGKKVMVFLDSNHTHDHVLAELEIYGTLVTKGSYCIVMDTICLLYTSPSPRDRG